MNLIETDIVRYNHLIDPQLHIWGWEIPVYLFLGGVTAGIMVLTGLMYVLNPAGERSRWARWLPFSAPILLSIGMFALLLDLEYKQHVWRFYGALRITSPMSWGSWILVFVYPATLLMGLAFMTRDEMERLRGWSPLRAVGLGGLLQRIHEFAVERLRGLAWLNVALGAGLGFYTGILLSSLGARPLWNSGILGPLFLASGLSTGAAFMMLFPLDHREHDWFRRWDLAAIGLEAVLLGLFIVSMLAGGGESGKEAIAMILGGPYTAPFWSLVVILGLVVPFLLEALEPRLRVAASRIVPALILVGGLSLRWILVSAGQV